jgi:cell division protein FtsI/penicillin-binding protein 2
MRQRRVGVVLSVLLLGLGLVELRLLRLQVLQADAWRAESLRSTRLFESLPAERGWILDRHGEPLAATEEVRDLTFRFRDWRQKGGSVAGHLLSLLWLLDGERRAVPDVHARVPELLDGLCGVTVSELAAVQPRQRRADVLSYLEWLLGERFDAALRAALAEPSTDPWLRLEQLPAFAEGRAAALRRAAEQADALDDLGRIAGLTRRELLEAVDGVVQRVDDRVEAALARDVAAGQPPADPFRRARELHTGYDAEPVELRRGASHDVQTLLAVRAGELRGFSVRVEQRRTYPERWADVGALLVGRLGAPLDQGPGGAPGDLEQAQANRERLAALSALDDPTEAEQAEHDRLSILVREVDYRSTDERGLFGVEAALEPALRGKRGWISELPGAGAAESLAPQRGLDVTLTLDVELQAAAEAVLDRALRGGSDGGPAGTPGALVLLDPRSGEVLALASAPRPTRADLARRWAELLADPWGPLCNRALGPGDSGNLPPPGSTFKPLEALVALRDGLVSPHDTWECGGSLQAGSATLRCLGVHPRADLRQALADSCNVWFYRFAARVGGGPVLEAARLFGYGQPTGLLAGNEALAGLGLRVEPGVPEWSVPLQLDPPPRGVDAMRCAIGQQRLDDVTPLQVAVALGAIGHGTLRPPQLVRAVEGYGEVPARTPVDLGCGRAELDVVRAALGEVVDSGTASALRGLLGLAAGRHPREPGVPRVAPADLARLVAGKTGTAQVAGRARTGGWLALRDPQAAAQSSDTLLPDHSWFAGWLPREEPCLAFAILLEHSGRHGGDACVPLLADLLYEPALQRLLQRETAP